MNTDRRYLKQSRNRLRAEREGLRALQVTLGLTYGDAVDFTRRQERLTEIDVNLAWINAQLRS